MTARPAERRHGIERGEKKRPARGRRKRPSAYHHGDLKRALIQQALESLEKTRQPGFTLRELAGRLGVSHAAAYRHFGSKDELLAAVAEEGFRLLEASLCRAEEEAAGGPLEVLLAKGMAYAGFALAHAAHFRVMFGPEPADKERFQGLQRSSREAFISLHRTVVAAQQAGLLDETDPQVISTTAWAAVHGVSALLVDGLLPGPLGLQMEPMDLAATVCLSAMRGFVRVDGGTRADVGEVP